MKNKSPYQILIKFLINFLRFFARFVYTFTYSEGTGRDGDMGYLPRPFTPHIRYLICHISNSLINFSFYFTNSLSHVHTFYSCINRNRILIRNRIKDPIRCCYIQHSNVKYGLYLIDFMVFWIF